MRTTLTMMMASRESVTTVSHTGRATARSGPQVSAMKHEVSRTLSATGSSMAPSVVRCPARRAASPSKRSVRPATTNTASAHFICRPTTSTTSRGESPMRTSVIWLARVRMGAAMACEKRAAPWGGPVEHRRAAERSVLEAVLLGDDLGHERLGRGFLRLADRALLEVARVLAEPAEAALAEAHAPALLRHALALGRHHHLAGGGVDEPRGERHLRLVLPEADVDALQAAALVLLLAAELGDRTRDDVADAEHLAQLGQLGRARIGAVAVGEVLFGQDGVELLALDDAERAVLDQLVHDLVGHALADVVVSPPVVADRAVVEVGDRHHRPLRLGRLRGCHSRQAQHADGRRQARKQLHSHLGSSLRYRSRVTIASAPQRRKVADGRPGWMLVPTRDGRAVPCARSQAAGRGPARLEPGRSGP